MSRMPRSHFFKPKLIAEAADFSSAFCRYRFPPALTSASTMSLVSGTFSQARCKGLFIFTFCALGFALASTSSLTTARFLYHTAECSSVDFPGPMGLSRTDPSERMRLFLMRVSTILDSSLHFLFVIRPCSSSNKAPSFASFFLVPSLSFPEATSPCNFFSSSFNSLISLNHCCILVGTASTGVFPSAAFRYLFPLCSTRNSTSSLLSGSF
mmetsp:Transcript_6697/g.9255  ORF Transcript_6697/g.9255 Transcript_6697/m.9255 type:complete len:211 (+) Transcript_6697:164-796(+)